MNAPTNAIVSGAMDEKARKTIALAEELIDARLLVADREAKLRAHVCDEEAPPSLRAPATAETRIVAYVVEKAPKLVTAAVAAQNLGIPLATVQSALHRLFERGTIVRMSHGCYTVMKVRE